MQVFKTLFILAGILSTPVLAKDLILISNGEWPPYMSEKLKHYGVASHTAQRAFELSGLKPKYKFFPWKRSMELAEKGEIHGTLGWVKNSKREESFYFSDPVFYDIGVLFYLKSRPLKWKKLEDLKGLKIGLIDNYTYNIFGPLVKKGLFRPIKAQDDIAAFKMLLKKQFAFIPASLDVGYALLQNNFREDERNLITHATKPYTKPYGLYLLLSKKRSINKIYIKKFNEGLRKLQESGEYEKMWEASRTGKYK